MTLPAESRAPVETLAGWRAAAARRVFLKDLRVDAFIGVHPHERAAAQPVVVSIDLLIDVKPGPRRMVHAPPLRGEDPAARHVVCYESLSKAVLQIVRAGHIDYVETLAERIADACLEDDRVVEALIRVEKPAAVAQATAAGVELLRRR